jgi:hypothetical protein
MHFFEVEHQLYKASCNIDTKIQIPPVRTGSSQIFNTASIKLHRLLKIPDLVAELCKSEEHIPSTTLQNYSEIEFSNIAGCQRSGRIFHQLCESAG